MISLIQAILSVILAVIETIFTTIIDLIFSLGATKKVGHNAEFGVIGNQLSKKGDTSFWIGRYCNGCPNDSHAIIFGGSGSHKSSVVAYVSLLQATSCSFFVFDPAGELLNGTAPFLESIDFNILVINLENISQSERFNMLAKCPSELQLGEKIKVCVDNARQDAPKDYWIQSAEDLILFCAKALYRGAEREYLNMANVLHLLDSLAIGNLDAWVSTLDSKTIAEFKSIIATPDKTLQSSIATARSLMSIYRNKEIAYLTSGDSIDFTKFRTEKTALFIVGGSPLTLRLHSPIIASVCESFFAEMLKSIPPPNSRKVMAILDEAHSFRMANLGNVLEIARKYLINVCTLWQDFSQIEEVYQTHGAANILANSRLKVWMPSGLPHKDCEILSRMLGKTTYQEDGVTKTKNLLEPQEIHQLDKILVLNKNEKPLLLKVEPYFTQPKLLAKTKLGPYVSHISNIITEPKLLKLA